MAKRRRDRLARVGRHADEPLAVGRKVKVEQSQTGRFERDTFEFAFPILCKEKTETNFIRQKHEIVVERRG